MPVAVGSGWRELSVPVAPDGPYFDNYTIFGVPPAWGREGWGMPVAVGSGWGCRLQHSDEGLC